MPSPVRKSTAKIEPKNLPRVPPGALVRVVALAALAVLASAWALVHMLTHRPLPMIVPAQPSAVPSEIPAPDTPDTTEKP